MSLDIKRLDTICALSSAQGFGAIAIVRASGPRAHEIFSAVFRNAQGIRPFVAMHGQIVDEHKEIVDDVMAILFVNGKSFTGEDSFEIHCHGNQLIVDQILQLLCRQGARLAEPGEFSMRALLNGKIDLAQAESVADLIHAKSLSAKRVALRGVLGGLREKTHQDRETIIAVLAEIEARMDFPDEELGTYDRRHLSGKLARSMQNLSSLLAVADHALKLHEGARVVICGLPNAGKSTLLNRLVGEERAIVHETAGTTRDAIDAKIMLNDIPITLVDVAGIREVDDSLPIEKIGIERAVLEIKRASVVIWLADCTVDEPFSDGTIRNVLAEQRVPILYVLNKIELAHHRGHDVLAISAKNGLGIDQLKAKLYSELISKTSDVGEMFITRARQREELTHALASLQEAKLALDNGLVDEIVTSELRGAGLAFDRLFGTDLSEDILDKIFSEFCIGK